MIRLTKNVLRILTLTIPLCLIMSFANARSVQENSVQVKEWNRFAQRLLAVHRQRVRNFSIREQEEIGGYAGMPEFYREVSFFDADTDRLLSRIRWEREAAARVHRIELFFYDQKGRLERDYSASYLPEYRNAPIQTLINIYGYNGELEAMRQFDASGARIFEHCRGSWFDEPVLIALDEPLIGTPDNLLNSEPYIACFAHLPVSPGKYLAMSTGHTSPETDREKSGSVEELIALLTLRLRFSPGNSDLHLQRCKAYFEIQEFDRAISDCDQALAADHTLAKAYFWRGMARGRAGEIEEAIADLSVYINSNPDSSLAFTKRGVRHIWNGDLKAAEADLKRAIELDPDNAEARDDLGVVLAQRRDYTGAIVQFEATIRLAPDYQKAHHNLALVLHLYGRHEEALSAIDGALALGTDVRSSVLLKGTILEALGRADEARDWKARAESMPRRNWSELMSIR